MSKKNSDGISTFLLKNLIVQYKFYFDQDKLTKPDVPLMKGYIKDKEITIENSEFVIQLLLTMLKIAKTIA